MESFTQEAVNERDSTSQQKEILIDNSFVKKKSFNEENLKRFRESGDFEYEVPEEEPSFLNRLWIWLKRGIINILESIFDDIGPALGFLRFILQALPYLALGIVIYLLIRYFIGVNTRTIFQGKNASLVNFSDDEELIKREDLVSLLEQALRDNDYRLAVRFSYLIVLKRLSESNMIEWQQEKTNQDYISELEGKKLQADFADTTRLYDFVWYGNFEIGEKEFQKTNRVFERLIKEKLE